MTSERQNQPGFTEVVFILGHRKSNSRKGKMIKSLSQFVSRRPRSSYIGTARVVSPLRDELQLQIAEVPEI